MTKAELQLRRVAYHEAGHAVSGWRLHLPLKGATIIAGKDYLGRVKYGPPPPTCDPDLDSGRIATRFCEKHVQCSLAGFVAEEIYLRRKLTRMERQQSDGDRNLADLLACRVYEGRGSRAPSLFRDLCEELARCQLKNNWWLVKALTAELLKEKTIGPRRLRKFLREQDAAKVKPSPKLLAQVKQLSLQHAVSSSAKPSGE